VGSIVPITIVIGAQTLTESTGTGTFVIAPAGNITAASINYGTGVLSLTFTAPATPTFTFSGDYYPGIPVMGIEEFESGQTATAPIDFPTNIYFDTVYSYSFNGVSFEDNSFYKSTGAPVVWSGTDYQQFNSCNYFRAMFVTNNNPGAQFLQITGVPVVGAVTQVTTSTTHNLTVDDYVFINEVVGVTNLNGFGGKVTAIISPTTFSVTTVTATAGAYVSGGIVQELTRSVSNTKDGIRWYDGQGSTTPGGPGFVNFSPPLAQVHVNGAALAAGESITYLVGARILVPFGNRLLAIGTYEDTSANILSGATPVYYGNRIRYCEVTATPFYGSAPTNQASPTNVGTDPNAWASNIQGFGGFIDLDTTQRIISAAVTQGTLILGLETEQRRMDNTGIETDPFSLQTINPEYGTAGTQAIVPMDKGILSVGEYGFLSTSSYDAQRFDLPILQNVFQINPSNNGYDRICGGRDFVNEVIHFSYPSIFDPEDGGSAFFPDTTLVYNYREGSFSLWYESATTYGLIKLQQKTWSALTDFVWDAWDLPWNAPSNVSTYPFVGFGTPQGYVMLKWANDSANDPSLMIQAIVANADTTYSITSPNHNLYSGAYVGFFPPGGGSASFIGCVAHLGDSGYANKDSVFTVNFDLQNSDPLPMPGDIVPGTWQCGIIDLPFVQTKQFPSAWQDAKKTRIGAQKYFLETTEFGEFTSEILGSQSPVAQNNNTQANPMTSIISSAIVRTRPDDSLGIFGNQAQQDQIWHRLPSSVIGDTVQLQFSFSDKQMRSVKISTSPWVLYTTILDLYPSRTLA
jgi:hypothetical protein